MKNFLLLILLCCVTTNIFSQADDCALATSITSNSVCGSPVVGTTSGATESMPACSGDADDDVWYKFTATSVSHSLAVTGSTNFSPVFEIYSGSCGTLSLIDCNDNASYGGTGSTHLTNLTIGNTYYFRVYHYYSGSGSSTFSVCLTEGVAPVNDECINAISITSHSVCTPVTGTSAWASPSMSGCSGNPDDDVWYKFTATAVSHSLAVTGSSNYSPVFEVFSGTCGSLTSLVCNDDASTGTTGTAHLLNLSVGTTYYVRVFHYYAGSGSDTFTMCLMDAPAPPNDECNNAVLVSASSTVCASPVTGTSEYASQSLPGCAGNADDDVWYKFVATATSHSLEVTGSGAYDAVVELFSGNCGTLTSITCSDMSGSGTAEVLHLNNFIIGDTYYFRVYNYYTSSGTNTFTVCVTTPPVQPPVNDDCSGATNLTVTPNCTPSNTVVTSLGATQSLSGCAGTADDDIWFKFTATNSNETINVTGDASADAVVQVFSGNCGTLNPLMCKDNSGMGQTEVVNVSNLSAGQVYYFRVYDYHSSGGKTFTISVVTRELTASFTSTTICSGSQITLNASGTPTFTWSNGVLNGVAFTPTASTVYTVSGIGTAGCVNTATVSVNISSPEIPDICMVTVDTINVNNVVYWNKSSYDNLDSMVVYREVLANTYQRIGAVGKTAYSRFIDTVRHIGFRNGDPHVRSYRYKLQIRDTCGNYSALSLYHTSLFLNNSAGAFTWNFYDIESQTSPVNNYELYRDDNNTGNFNLIGTIPSTLGVTSYTFTDPNYSIFASTARWGVTGDGFLCYPSFRAGMNSPSVVVNKSKSNVKNNFTIVDPPADPDPQSVKELSLEAYVQLMPNPANDVIHMASAYQAQKLTIYNSLGAVVQTVTLNNETHTSISLTHLSNGIYNVEVMLSKGKVVKKLVIYR